MIPFVEELKKLMGLKNFVVVADRGLNNTANIHCLVELGHDMYSHRRLGRRFRGSQAAALCPEGRISYTVVDDDGVVEKLVQKRSRLKTKVNYRYPEFAKEHDNPAEIERLGEDIKAL